MLKNLTGIQAVGGAVVAARRSGAPTVELLDQDALIEAQESFLERCNGYFDDIYLEMLRNPQKGS